MNTFNQPNLAEVLMQRFNIPRTLLRNPNAIIQHLVSSGQVSQERLNQAYQQMRNLGL